MFDFFKKKKTIKEEVVIIDEEISLIEKEDNDKQKEKKLEEYKKMRKEKEELWKKQEEEKKRIEEEERQKKEEENFDYVLNGGTLETNIGFIDWWNSEEEKSIKCNLSFKNHEIHMDLYEKDQNIISNIQMINGGIGIYVIETSETNYIKIIHISCDNELISTFSSDKHYNIFKFEEHFKILNKVYIKNQEDFHNRIQLYFNDLIINNEVKQLVHSYIVSVKPCPRLQPYSPVR